MFGTPSCNGVDEAFMDKATKSTRERIFGAMAKGMRGLVLQLGLHTALYIPQSQESFEGSSRLAFVEALTGAKQVSSQNGYPVGKPINLGRRTALRKLNGTNQVIVPVRSLPLLLNA